MKKFFALAAIAVLALASCSNNTLDPQSQKAREINFNTVANKATRAPITGTTYSYNCPAFGVFAYYLASGNWNTAAANSSAVSYMNNVTVSFDDGIDIWKPSSTYYWPLQGKLTFIAYSPAVGETGAPTSATFSNAGLLTLSGFTVNSTVADQVDLLYSSINADKEANEAPYVDAGNYKNSGEVTGVNIKFKHALSQVIFKAKAADDVYAAGLSFKIDSIVVNAPSTATSMTVSNPADNDESATITTWNSPSTPANFVVSGAAFPEAANTYLTDEFSDPIGDALLMIPLTSFEGTNYNVRVRYTLYRLDGNVNLGSKAVNIKFDDVDDVVTAWQAGKKYVYNLTIDLQKIYFNPTITDWVDAANPQPVPVPGN